MKVAKSVKTAYTPSTVQSMWTTTEPSVTTFNLSFECRQPHGWWHVHRQYVSHVHCSYLARTATNSRKTHRRNINCNCWCKLQSLWWRNKVNGFIQEHSCTYTPLHWHSKLEFNPLWDVQPVYVHTITLAQQAWIQSTVGCTASVCTHHYTGTASLNSIHSGMYSQCTYTPLY